MLPPVIGKQASGRLDFAGALRMPKNKFMHEIHALTLPAEIKFENFYAQ